MRFSTNPPRFLHQDLAEGLLELVQLAKKQPGHCERDEGAVLQYGGLDHG